VFNSSVLSLALSLSLCDYTARDPLWQNAQLIRRQQKTNVDGIREAKNASSRRRL
jgi:hypothetical protein